MRAASVIMHYQLLELTTQTLAQLAEVPDVFIFDDGSEPPLRFLASTTIQDLYDATKTYMGARLLHHCGNQGYVAAVNSAMAALVDFDAVWVLNNDITGISKAMLDQLTEVLERFSMFAAVSPAVTPSPHREMRAGPEKVRTERFIDWVCPLVRTDVWRGVGGFDPALKGFGCDLQYCYDARKAGWMFGVLPRLVVNHRMGATARTVGNTDHSDMSYMNSYLCGKYGVKNWEALK